MKFYKEIALKAMFYNGKEYAKGDTIRERVPLSDVHIEILKETPEITNCKYELIKEGVKEEKPVIQESKKKLDLTKNINYMNVAELTALGETLGLRFKEGTAKRIMTVAIDKKQTELKSKENA